MADTRTPPNHVAIIMDGNGRWAKQRSKPRPFGHKAGRGSVDRVVRAAAEAGVGTLSLFAFSTENWSRPKAEIQLIMELMQRNIASEASKLAAQNIRMRILGDKSGLPEKLQREIARAEAVTAESTGMNVVLAVNYSGRWAILETAKKLASLAQQGVLAPDAITEADFAAARPIPDLPPVDLLIRSSGEMRISNYHLWEMAYAELYFTDTLWPDFTIDEFARAIDAYHARSRRFGGLSPEPISV